MNGHDQADGGGIVDCDALLPKMTEVCGLESPVVSRMACSLTPGSRVPAPIPSSTSVHGC